MLVKIGTVTKPQGLRGEFRVKVFDLDYFEDMDKVFIDTERKVEKILFNPTFIVLKVEGIDDRDKAEDIRGLDVKAEKRAAKPLKKGAYKIDDLIGKEVAGKKGEKYGKLISIDSFGAADVFTVKRENGKEFSFPNARKIIVKVEENIVIDGEILKEIGMDL